MADDSRSFGAISMGGNAGIDGSVCENPGRLAAIFAPNDSAAAQLFQDKSNAPDRMHQPAPKAFIDLVAQPRNMHVDHIVERNLPADLFPDFPREHLARDHPTLVSQKILKDFKLPHS